MVRKQRNRIAILQTDHKDLFLKMEKKLHELHAIQMKINEIKLKSGEDIGDVEMQVDEERKQPKAVEEEVKHAKPKQKPVKEWIPFLWVGEVSEDSPAHAAGLLSGDAVVKFEEVTHEHPEGLNKVAEIVKNSEGLVLKLKVIRKVGETSEVVDLRLMPKTWAGRGMLGCYLSKNPI